MKFRQRAIRNTVYFTLALSVLSLCYVSESAALSPTTSGTLTQDETWNGNVILTGDVVVPAGIILVIEPGSTIYFTALGDDQAGGEDPARTELIIEGALIAEQATFTSSNLLSQARGDWGGIRLVPGQDDTNTSFNDCTVEYANIGITALFSGHSGHLHIAGSRIRQNLSDGIAITGENGADFTIDLRNNIISENDYRGLSCHLDDAGTLLDGMITANSIYDNKGSGIRLLADGGERVGVLIEGNEIHGNRYYGINFESRAAFNYLTVSRNNIYNTDLGVYFGALAGISDTIISANEINNGTAGIYLLNQAGQPLTATIEQNTITNNIGHGIGAVAISDNALIDIDIRNNSVTANTGNGIELIGTSPYQTDIRSTITLNTLLDNEGWGIYGQTLASADIFYNDIRQNGQGIYAATAEKSNIHYNNLYDNLNVSDAYELENGGSTNIDARFNYWGSLVTEELSTGSGAPDLPFSQLVRHINQDPALGRIHTSEWLTSEVTIPAGPQSQTLAPVFDSINNNPTIMISGIAVAPFGVDSVEVSFDSGLNWHAAEGKTNWQLEWHFAQDGTNTVATRVTDNLGQVYEDLPGNPFVVDSTLTGYAGELSSHTTWENQVIITGDVIVPAGVTLSIAPGTVVRFQARHDDQAGGNNDYRTELIVNGSLSAEQATFTSADSNHPIPGDWLGIRFEPQEENPTFELINCTVEYAATGVDITVAAPVVQSNITVLDSTINQNGYDGIAIVVKDGARVDFQMSNSQITANGTNGVSTEGMDPLTQFYVLLMENTIAGNGYYGINSRFMHSTDNGLTASDNHIQNNTIGGISVSVSGARSDIEFRSNIISDYNLAGIKISLSGDIPDSQVQIRSNEIYNGTDGITIKDSVVGSTQVDITDNTIFNHIERGIEIYKDAHDAPSMQAAISGNRIFTNGGNGIELGDSNYQITSDGEIEADITLNTVQGNGGYGLYLLVSKPIDIKFNEIYANNGGLYLRTGVDALVQYNDIYENGSGFALELVHLSQYDVDARFNYWGTAPTAQMDTGPNPKNIDVIFDDLDDAILGTVDYAGWLGQSITTLDTDADALTDRQEFEIGTDPQDSDTDDDLASDGVEVRSGSDPSDDQSLPYTLYEDAEDGAKTGWFVYAGDGSSAAIENVIDSDRDGRVISLSGSGVDHGYALFDSDGTEWNNTAEFMAEWHLKYSEPYVVYIEVQTTAGRRYLQYTPVDYSNLGDGATIHHGVGAHTTDGAWHMLTRDLNADLKEAQPDVDILAVNAFLIRGSGLVDDIKLSSHTADSDLDGLADISETGTHATDPNLIDTDGDGLTDSAEINVYGTNPNDADSDQDGIDDQTELALWENDAHLDSDNDSLPNLLDADSDNDGIVDGTEMDRGTDPADALSAPPTVYEDAEAMDTDGWFVYTGDPGSAAIANVEDVAGGNRAIELNGDGQVHGYALYGDNYVPWQNDRQFIIEWRLKFNEFFTVYVEVQTTDGRRYLQYTPVDYDNLGTGSVVHHGVGFDSMDGSWRRFIRNLADDLNSVQPDAVLQSVEGYLIRGSGRIDDIKLWTAAPDTDGDGLTDLEENNIYYTSDANGDTDGDGLTDSAEINVYGTNANDADSDQDGIDDQTELALWENDAHLDSDNDSLTNLLDADSDNDGIVDGEELARGTDPADALSAPPTVYEDAEAMDTDGWFVYTGDPGSAAIANVEDVVGGNRAIELNGEGQVHGYALYGDNYVPWQNDRQFIIEWRLKFNEFFTVYVEVQTTAGRRYLQYTPVDYDNLGTGSVVHHGVGFDSMDGSWRRFIRNLADDLNSVQPDAVLQSVEGYLIRGSGRIDDIKLWTAAPDTDGDGLTDLEENNIYYTSAASSDTDGDGISDSEEITDYSTDPTAADTDADGSADGTELAFWQLKEDGRWNVDYDGDGLVNLVDPDSDDDGVPDGVEISLGSDPEDSSDSPSSVYEDAEDEQTIRWDIYDGDQATASIVNMPDPERGNQVIALAGESTIHGFRLGTETSRQWKNTAQFTLELGIKFSEYYIIYVDVQTSNGHRYLKYTPSDYSDLGGGEYVHHGLGWDSRNGQWHDVTIDLLSDLQEAQPEAAIIEVNGLLIRGSGRIDDVRLRN